MRTLIYKRTHKGDPDERGCFGVWDCMGRVRDHRFDAVIGVGGIGAEPTAQGIARKVNWIGIGARKKASSGDRGPQITFDHFVLFEEKGRKLSPIAPILARRMYSTNGPRRLISDNLSEAEQAEVSRLLELAKNAPPSAAIPHRNSRAKGSA